MSQITVQKSVPVTAGYDAVILGGGPAGWVAAVAAARSGCRAALVERFGFLGGTATAGLVLPISKFCFGEKRVVGGIAWEFVKRMESRGAAQVELPKGHVSYDPEYYKLVAQQMVLEAGVHMYTNAVLSGCAMKGGLVTHAMVENKGGTQAIAGKVFIDATGDGDLARFAGMPFLPGDGDLQPMSMCFLLNNVDAATNLMKHCIHHDGRHGASVNHAIHERLIKIKEREDVPQFGGPWFNTMLNGNQVAVNITRAAADATDPEMLTRAEMKMREDAFRLTELLRQNFPEFKACYIASTAAQGGVRETRHLKGVHTLTGEELARGEQFPDTIALCAHPMDFHSPKDDSQRVVPLTVPGRVPFRCMYARGFENLICAGRCVSADRTAYASLRVQATVMAIGEAAGTAAGLMRKGGTMLSGLDTEKLRGVLIENGAVI